MNSAALSPNGARILTASNDNTARVWDAATAHEIAALRGHEGGVSRASFSPNGARIVTASDENTARVWDAATGREIASISLDAVVTALAVADGVFALGDALGRIHVFEAGTLLLQKANIP